MFSSIISGWKMNCFLQGWYSADTDMSKFAPKSFMKYGIEVN